MKNSYTEFLQGYSWERIVVLSHTNTAVKELIKAVNNLPELKNVPDTKLEDQICTIHSYFRAEYVRLQKYEKKEHEKFCADSANTSMKFWQKRKPWEKHPLYEFSSHAHGKELSFDAYWAVCDPQRYDPYNLHTLKELKTKYNKFREDNKKLSFEDMIDNFLLRGETPTDIDILIVDEAQDCSKPQIKALQKAGKDAQYDFKILDAVIEVNDHQKVKLIPKIDAYFDGNLKGKTIAMWGLAFKPETDDIREAPALYMIDKLLELGVEIVAFDPEAMDNVKSIYGDKISYGENLYDVLEEANFLIIAWRGFNGNSGKPSEQGLYDDAKSAVSWLKSIGIKEEKIILYGESLGAAVAIEIAQNKKFAGIVLESPFTSMVEIGKKYYPIFPVSFLLKDRYESINKIKKIYFPVLVMHGKKDSIVPFEMGKKIYTSANSPKFYYFSEYDDHMIDYNKLLIEKLKSFIESLN